MKNFPVILFFLLIVIPAFSVHAQIAPSIEWQKCFGGDANDVANSIQQTTDGGFIVAGCTYSHNNGDVWGYHICPYYSCSDYWILKLDSVGNIEWKKCLGGHEDDLANSIQQTVDGGFIVAGETDADDGDVSGNHGSSDYWIVKLDVSGNIDWQKCFGGGNTDEATSIFQKNDGGFIVTGAAESNNDDVSGNHGDQDYWITSLDTLGNLVWQKCLGGTSADYAFSIQQTVDGGFIVAGVSRSSDGDVTENHGDWDYWIVKLDTLGSLQWEKSIGGSEDDHASSIQQTADQGFIIAGHSLSNDGDVIENHGAYDVLIVKLDSAGNLAWKKCLGGSINDKAFSIDQTTDGGYIVAGFSNSDDGDVLCNSVFDYWILKLDSVGDFIWQQCLGGSFNEEPHSIDETFDGGFIIAGFSNSNDGDVSGNHINNYGVFEKDYWIVKLSLDIPTGIISSSNHSISLSLSPNPVQSQLTIVFSDLTESGINVATAVDQIILRVYDLQGKMITLPCTLTSTQAQLDTEKLPNGFYTLHLLNNKIGTSEVAKFVKEN